MALEKEINSNIGIPLTYHRIVSLNKITNVSNIIEIASYINKEKRQEEEDAMKRSLETGVAEQINVYIETININKEYNENETIIDAYDYLKTLDKFKDAKDI